VTGLLIALTGRRWLDPATSLAIVAVIAIGTWGLLRDSLNLATDAVPSGIDLPGVAAALRALPDVTEVHDLHVWALSTTETALTAHLVRDRDGDTAPLLRLAARQARERFGIGHATFQIETTEVAETCDLRPAGVV